MARTPATSDMLSELSGCAHRLGVAFAAEAEAAEDWERKLELVQLFDRCFFSVRVAVALQLRLRREAAPRENLDIERNEGLEIERPKAAERSDTAHTYNERDRDREGERASLPLLLSTLSGVAADAGALSGPAPAALPTLRELLARVGAETAAPSAPRRPPLQMSGRTGPSPATPLPTVPLRARLSAGVALAIPPGPTTARPLRRATGPPRR